MTGSRALTAMGAGAVVGAAVAVSRAVARRGPAGDEPARWLSVTAQAEPDAVAADPRFTEAYR